MTFRLDRDGQQFLFRAYETVVEYSIHLSTTDVQCWHNHNPSVIQTKHILIYLCVCVCIVAAFKRRPFTSSGSIEMKVNKILGMLAVQK